MDEWFNCTHAEGWPDLGDNLTWHWDEDQRSLTIRHKAGKRIGITLPSAIITAMRLVHGDPKVHDWAGKPMSILEASTMPKRDFDAAFGVKP